MMNAPISRCPFCGDYGAVCYPNHGAKKGSELGIPNVDTFFVHCDSCGAEGPPADSEPQAVEAWNTMRYSLTPEGISTFEQRIAALESQLAKVQEERDEAQLEYDGIKQCMSIVEDERDEAVSQIALAREALEHFNHYGYDRHWCGRALSTLTTGNAVREIEARALREAANSVDAAWHADAPDFADLLRKLAEQKEKGAK